MIKEEPIILLLEDHARDHQVVGNVLALLEQMNVVSVRHDDKNALDFFSNEVFSPQVIVMYMDRQEITSIELSENAYLLKLREFGLKEIESHINCIINPAGSNCPISLLDFLSSVCISKDYIPCVAN
jgi:hypothetical protein